MFLTGGGEVVQVLEVEPVFGGVLEYLPKRSAVAAVMPRRPLMMEVIRL